MGGVGLGALLCGEIGTSILPAPCFAAVIMPTAAACLDADIPLYNPSASTTAVPDAFACTGSRGTTPCQTVPLPLANGTTADACDCQLSYGQVGCCGGRGGALRERMQWAACQCW